MVYPDRVTSRHVGEHYRNLLKLAKDWKGNTSSQRKLSIEG